MEKTHFIFVLFSLTILCHYGFGIETHYLDRHCNGTINVSGAIILLLTSNTSYQPNLKCQTLVRGAGGRLMVYFDSIDIENEGTCNYDWVELDDGNSRMAPYIAGGKKCGDMVSSDVYTTTGEDMTVYFQSDESNQLTGFRMIITRFVEDGCIEHQCDNGRCIQQSATCQGYNTCGDGSDCDSSVEELFLYESCGTTHNVSGQVHLQLTRNSPYPPNINCQMNLVAPLHYRFMVFFRSLDVENETTCNYDWVEVDDGNSRSSGYITGRKLCGNKAPVGLYETSGRFMTVYFHSDGSQQFSGFDMVITSYHSGTCLSGEHECANGRCIRKFLTCWGYNPCGDYSDCAAGSTQRQLWPTPTVSARDQGPVYYMDEHCGGVIRITSFAQFHLKLTQSSSYSPSFNCEVSLETNPGDHMTIKILSIDTENGYSCTYDWLELDDGDTRAAPYVSGTGGKVCGQNHPSGYFSTQGNILTAYFRSDSSVQGSGFDLLIHPSVTEYMDQNCGGTINVGEYSQIRLKLTNHFSYLPSYRCQVLLETKYEDKMMFYFKDVDMDICYNHYLEIDDGSSRSDPYLADGQKCGHTTPTGVYTSTGRHMLLYFESDSNGVQGRGFDMIITSFREAWYCHIDEFNCASDRCINESLACNGYNSCGDFSDCSTRNCKSDEFRCNNGRCIPISVQCNGQNPCGDYSDCPLTTTTTTTTTTEYSDDYYYTYFPGLPGLAIAGIVVGCIVFFSMIFVTAVCYRNSSRRRTLSQQRARQMQNVATINSFSVVPNAYENPVPIYYSDAPPPYPGTSGTLAYPGTTNIVPDQTASEMSRLNTNQAASGSTTDFSQEKQGLPGVTQ